MSNMLPLLFVLLLVGDSFPQSAVNPPRSGSGMLEHPVAITQGTKARYKDDVADTWYATAISADALPEWDINVKNPLVIAIVDSGIDASHPEFASDLWRNKTGILDSDTPTDKIGWDFIKHKADPVDNQPTSHGTHVAGLASARLLRQWLPAFKSAPLDNLELLILKVADINDEVDHVEPAIEAAARKNAKIVSGSWTLASDSAVKEHITRHDFQMLFVLAAGNGDDDNNGQLIDPAHPIYPASFGLGNVITVGATGPDDKIAYFSNYGPNFVQIFAPGVFIKSTIRSAVVRGTAEPYGRLSGTSQAVPLVSLAAALIWEKDGSLNAEEVKARIITTSDFVGDTITKGCGSDTPSIQCGGRLNLAKAVTIDHDVMQDGRGLKIGTIENKTIDFAVGYNSCQEEGASIKTYSVAENHIRRLVSLKGGGSILFADGKALLGAACDDTIKLKVFSPGEAYASRKTVGTRVRDVKDLVWAIYRPED